MIPKTIHYCWLSGDPFPELIDNCINSWKKQLPDYEFILWDTNRFPMDENKWVKEAYEAKKYAFAADYIRLYVIYNYGGIYLDTDIQVLKSFNTLLHLPYFLGSEGNTTIEAGVFGAQKGTPWLANCLSYYKNRTFIKVDGSFDIITLPKIMIQCIQKDYKIIEMSKATIEKLTYTEEEKILHLFPKEYFCAKNHGTGVIEKTKNTFSIHHFAMSWISKKNAFLPNLKRKLITVFGVNFINFIVKIFALRKLKKIFLKA